MNWHSKPLGDCVKVFDSLRCPITKKDRISGSYPYYGASGIVDYIDSYIYEGLHILVAEDGENLRSRKVPIAYLANGRFWVNNHAHVLTANDENDTRFLAYRIESIDLSPYITGSTQPKLSQAALLSIPLSVPPKEEQRRIASLLGALDDKIESNNSISEATFKLAEELFLRSAAMRRRIEDVASVVMGSSPPSSSYNDHGNGIMFFQGVRDFSTIHPTPRTFTVNPRRIAHRGDILFSVRAPVGRVNIAYSPCCIGRGLAAIKSEQTATCFMALKAASTEWSIFSEEGTVFGSVNQESLKSTLVLWPSQTEEGRLERSLETLLRSVSHSQLESIRLADLRDALLPELMSGRMHVNEAGRLVSEALDEEVDDA